MWRRIAGHEKSPKAISCALIDDNGVFGKSIGNHLAEFYCINRAGFEGMFNALRNVRHFVRRAKGIGNARQCIDGVYTVVTHLKQARPFR